MLLKKWGTLPDRMQTEAVKPYYDMLQKKMLSLVVKRMFDIAMSLIMLILCSPVLLIVSIWVKMDSTGNVFYKQMRVTQYGKEFKIFKFRTMVSNADTIGSLVTVNDDSRITKAGRFLRKYRIDEIPQLINIFLGDMTFVGTRPEVKKYVDCYTDEMLATLLLPAGATSAASIAYKDEMQLLANASNIDEAYIQEVLPEKMKCNFEELRSFDFWSDIKVMIKTVLAIVK